jgi:hypothetical protein
MAPNRVVAVLTPLLFAPLAGAIAAWLAEHFPGFQVDQGALTEVFIAGALIALAPAAQWLSGWQKFEARQAQLERDVALAGSEYPDTGEPRQDEDESPGLDGLEALDELEELDDLDELEALDVLDELDELEGLDDLDPDLLADDEAPVLGS